MTVLLVRVVTCILCMSLATGCSTLKPLAPAEPESILSRIKPGDKLRLITRDGKVREFTLREATAQQLVGENESVNLSDITDIERREFSIWKTSAVVIGTTVLLYIISYISTKSMNLNIGRID